MGWYQNLKAKLKKGWGKTPPRGPRTSIIHEQRSGTGKVISVVPLQKHLPRNNVKLVSVRGTGIKQPGKVDLRNSAFKA